MRNVYIYVVYTCLRYFSWIYTRSDIRMNIIDLKKTEREKLINILDYLKDKNKHSNRKQSNLLNEYAISKAIKIPQPTVKRIMNKTKDFGFFVSSSFKPRLKRHYNLHYISFKGLIYLYKNKKELFLSKKGKEMSLKEIFDGIYSNITECILKNHPGYYLEYMFFPLIFGEAKYLDAMRVGIENALKEISFDIKWNLDYEEIVLRIFESNRFSILIQKYGSEEVLSFSKSLEELNEKSNLYIRFKNILLADNNYEKIISALQNEIRENEWKVELHKLIIDHKKKLLNPLKLAKDTICK